MSELQFRSQSLLIQNHSVAIDGLCSLAYIFNSPEWEHSSNYKSFITDSAFSDVQAASSTGSDRGHSVTSSCIQNPVDAKQAQAITPPPP